MPTHDQYAWLGMYDFLGLRPAQDAWWAGLAGHFLSAGFENVPAALSRSDADPYDIWQSPDLFLAQTCGYPLTHKLSGKVRLVGAPCYDAPGCDGPLYRSFFIVRADSEFENLAAALQIRIAVNDRNSFSGWQVFRKMVGPSTETVISGSHAESIDLVREGGADIAAIDCVTHALIGDVEPERLAGTRILEQSASAPGLPYITRVDRAEADVRRMVEAIDNAFADADLADARRALRLASFKVIPLQEYKDFMT